MKRTVRSNILGEKNDFTGLSRAGKAAYVIIWIICLPVLLPALAIFSIFYLFLAPFEYMRYAKSAYFKKYKIKYSFGITHSVPYKIICFLENEGIHYNSFDHEAQTLHLGENTYFLPWFEGIFFDDSGKCFIEENEGDEPVSLSDDPRFISVETGKVLIQESHFDGSDLEKAKSDERFAIYDKISDLKNIFDNKIDR